jgi:D-alanyl-D-alanine carboxypeptidase/D-alanyl-D-alanine-endopeptidase (penicillin-binding protein 4)
MRPVPHIFLFLFLILHSPLGIIAAAADSVEHLQRDLDEIFSDSRFSSAQWGVHVISLEHSELLYEKNSKKLYVPASNTKILTASAALMRLGPEYCFKTQVMADGPILDGILKGNLIIVGFGDPSSSSRIPPMDPFQSFRIWAAKLKQQGVRSIEGNIIGDGAAFDEIAYGNGWAWDDLKEGYAAPVSALQFNENSISIALSPGLKIGSYATAALEPLSSYLNATSQVITESPKKQVSIEIERSRSDEWIVARGVLPLTSSPVVRLVAVQSPIRYYLAALKQVLIEEGIDASRCSIEEMRGYGSASAYLLWTHTSPPLSELLVPALKLSLNLMSESFLRTLGLEFRGEGTFAKGKEVVEETLTGMGIAREDYSYADGSGLSRLNLVSAGALAGILKYMYRQPQFPVFYNSLSIAGVDGTLKARMKGSKAENNVHAKTGTLTNVSSISGYVRSADGEMLAFSFIANNFLASKNISENIQDEALKKLASFSRPLPGGPKISGDTDKLDSLPKSEGP